MEKTSYNIIFVKDYIEKVLKEINYPIDKMVDMIKHAFPDDGVDAVPNLEEYDNFSKELTSIIGKYDFTNFIKLQCYVSNILGLNSWDINLISKRRYGLGHGFTFDDDNLLMHNSLLCTDEEQLHNMKFKDTYSIMITNSSTIVVTLKDGFSNFISEVQGNVNKKDLLCEIVNLLPREVALTSRLAMSYLTLRSKINIK